MAHKIRNIKDLQAEKLKLQQRLQEPAELSISDMAKTVSSQLIDKGLSSSDLLKATSSSKKNNVRDEVVDEAVKIVLTLAVSSAVTRFNMGKIPKLLLTAGAAWATPYIVDKLQEKFKK